MHERVFVTIYPDERDDHRPQRPLVVRPITLDERQRFDVTLQRSHWLGAGLVGEVMRYVALEDGEWCALVGFGSAALCVRSREVLLAWSDEQRHRRLRYITNNQRFCVLDNRPNLASEVLAVALRRLSGDFELLCCFRGFFTRRLGRGGPGGPMRYAAVRPDGSPGRGGQTPPSDRPVSNDW